MKVIVKPVPTTEKRWAQENGKGKYTLEPAYDYKTGRYRIGLTDEELAEMGKNLGYDMSPYRSNDGANSFWKSRQSKIMLPMHSIVWDTGTPLDRIYYELAKLDPVIANSWKEYKQGLWPEARYYMTSDEMESEQEAGRAVTLRKAAVLIDEMSDKKKADVIAAISGEITHNRNSNYIDARIGDLIESDPKMVVKWASEDLERLDLVALVKKGLKKNVLRNDNQGIYFGDTHIGYDEEGAVEFFRNVDHQAMKLQIKDLINKAM